MQKRLKCCVPFCRRTTARADFTEWICGEHWRLLPLRARRVYGRYTRRWRRYSPLPPVMARDRIWQWLKRRAIERAAGIG
jgi:hydroxyacyl-ACP dehydratase HTD2-like protein with hotdog domain